MKLQKYKVHVYGRNYFLVFEDEGGRRTRRTGFYVWRCVEAADPFDAELKAVQMIRDAPQLAKGLKNSPTNSPVLFVESVVPVEDFAPLKPPGSGFCFFHGRGSGVPRQRMVVASRAQDEARAVSDGTRASKRRKSAT